VLDSGKDESIISISLTLAHRDSSQKGAKANNGHTKKERDTIGQKKITGQEDYVFDQFKRKCKKQIMKNHESPIMNPSDC
jgi:hypothetical protein